MVRRPGVPNQPRDYVTADGTWPDGPWLANTPRTVLVAATIATRLRAGILSSGMTNTATAARMGISRQALQDVLSGRRMPDLHTLVLAEDTLGVTLWPSRP